MANELRDWRIKTILLEMVAGTWARTKRAHYAEQWDVSIQTVEEYTRAAEVAAKALVSPDADVMRANMHATIEMIRERLLKRDDVENDVAALAACRDIAKLYGLNAPERRQVAVEGPAKETVAAITSELEQWEPLRH